MKFKYHITESSYIHHLTDWSLIDHISSILESFNKPADVNTIENTSKSFKTEFTVNDKIYIYHSKIIDELAILLFYPVDGEIDLFKERKDKAYIGKVFASIFVSIRMMLKVNKQLNTIGFIADNKSLEILYDIMNNIIVKRFPQWIFDKKFKNNSGKIQYSYIKRGL